MTTILAYLWTPIIAALLAVGIGLLVERLARWPLPGDGYNGVLGPLALEPIRGGQSLVRVAPRDAKRQCEGRWDRVEAVGR